MSDRGLRAGPVAHLAAILAFACSDPTQHREKGGLRTIRLFAQPHLSAAPLFLAESEGYFRDEGLAIEWFSSGSSHDMLAPLVSGQLDVLTANLSPIFLNAIAQGARIRIVADKGHLARDGCDYLALLARPELLRDGRLVRRPDGGPWRISYRRGSFYELLFDHALVASALPRDQFEVHFLRGQVEIQALVQGSIDIATDSGTSLQALVDSGGAAIWLRAQDLHPDGQAFVMLFGGNLLDRESETGLRFMTAYLRGVRRYNLGKTERNVDVLAQRLGAPREEVERACWISIRGDGRVDLPSIAELAQWSLASERLVRPLAIEEIWEPRFVEIAVDRIEARDAESGVGAAGLKTR